MEANGLRSRFAHLVQFLFLIVTFSARLASADGQTPPMPPGVEQLARAVLLVNLQLKAARVQWNSAPPRIRRSHVPAPAFTYLQAANQLLVLEVAPEQTVGGPVSQ